MPLLYTLFIGCCLLLSPTVTASSEPVDTTTRIDLVTEPWPPFMGPELRHQGLMTDIVSRVFEALPYRMKLDFVPWARAMEMARQGQTDGVLGIYPTESRRQYLMFSEPVFVEPNVLYAHKNNLIRFQTIDDLKPYSIGVVRGASNGDAFDRATELNKVLLTTSSQSIEMLLLGRIDLLAGPERVIEYLLDKNFKAHKEALVRLTPILGEKKLTLGICKQWPEAADFMRQFNQALQQLKSDGTYDRIIKRHGVKLLTDHRVLQ